MKVTLELSTEIDTTKEETSYKVTNAKFDNINDETILDKKLKTEEDAKYAAMAEAMTEYYRGRTLVIYPVD